MKTFFLSLFIVVISFSATSCNNDDDNKTEPIVEEPQNHPIVGKWSLVRYEGYPLFLDYEPEQIIWEFTNENKHIVTITENVYSPHPYTTSQTNDYSIGDDTIALFRQYEGQSYPYNGVKFYRIEEDTLEIYYNLDTDGSYFKFLKE